MVSKNMQERLNKHMNNELQAAYAYLGLATYCRSISMEGMAHWFDIQAQEELAHAMKFYNYLLDQDCPVKLLDLKGVPSSFKTLLEVFKEALKNEEKVTAQINDLVTLAISENDHATNIFLQWFVTEQIEEESNLRDVIDRVSLVKESGDGILMLDKELGTRQPEEEA